MKKFLTTLIVIIVAVSLGFGVFYLVRDNERISIGNATLYRNVGEPFEISLDVENSKSHTKVEVKSTNSKVLEMTSDEVNIDKKAGKITATFKGLTGGTAKVVFKTNNANYRNLSRDIIICDGTLNYPYRISNARELLNINADETTRSKCYVLTNDIDLGTLADEFVSISDFSGVLDGNGYSIQNLRIANSEKENVGLFENITATGVVKNVKFTNVTLTANNNNLAIGTVAGINNGTIERVVIENVTLNNTVNADTYMGGVVGKNVSINTPTERSVARINRVAVGSVVSETEYKGLNVNSTFGVVGGITAHNNGGVVINNYVIGNIENLNAFGGIVAVNDTIQTSAGEGVYDGALNGNVKDNYVILNFNEELSGIFATIVGQNNSSENKIVGNYYISNVETNLGLGASDFIYGSENQNFGTKAISTDDLKDLNKLISYKQYEKEYRINGNQVNLVDKMDTEKIVLWDNTVWQIDNTINAGFPILNMADQATNDNFEQSGTFGLISNEAQLKEIKNNLAGAYYISESITLLDAWTPIGTKETPFTGSLIGAEGVVIENVYTTGNIANCGFFGYIGKSGVVSNLNLKSVLLTGDYVGAIAGVNEGSILNSSVVDGTINGTNGVGGIAGLNSGMIMDAHVSGVNGLTISDTNTALKPTLVGVGGIAGINDGYIANADNNNTVNLVTGKVNILTQGKTNLSLGGIAGVNNNTVSYAKVNITDGAIKATALNSDIELMVGGVAGYSVGVINNTMVLGTTINGTTSSDHVYAGGLVGSLSSKQERGLTNSLVKNSTIVGTNAGGFAGYMTNIGDEKIEIAFDDWNLYGSTHATNIDSLKKGIFNCGVEGSSLAGERCAGMVSELAKGLVSNSYAKVKLNGNNNAGFAWTIGYNAENSFGGVMYKVYSDSTALKGTSYAVSSNELFKVGAIFWYSQDEIEPRKMGFVDTYQYVETDTMDNPKYQWFWGGYKGSDTSTVNASIADNAQVNLDAIVINA